ncbi:MAG: isochorismatase family protein [Rectinemataceae bacterium]
METTHPALLIMDVQNGTVRRFAEKPEAIEAFPRALAAARGAGIPVIFVRIAFREGYPEVSPRNKSFSTISTRSPTPVSTPIRKSSAC